MDGKMLMLFIFIVAIVAVVLGVGNEMLRNYLQYRERRESREAKGDRDGSGTDWRRLEERVRVLERIATDSNHTLASQIAQLREFDTAGVHAARQEIGQ